jgi:hypothetical protein
VTSNRQAARARRTDGPAAGPSEPKVTAPRAPNASDGTDLAGPERVGGVDVVDEPAVMVPRLLAAAGARSAAGAPSKRLHTPWDGDPWSHCSVGCRSLEPLLRGMETLGAIAPWEEGSSHPCKKIRRGRARRGAWRGAHVSPPCASSSSSTRSFSLIVTSFTAVNCPALRRSQMLFPTALRAPGWSERSMKLFAVDAPPRTEQTRRVPSPVLSGQVLSGRTPLGRFEGAGVARALPPAPSPLGSRIVQCRAAHTPPVGWERLRG